MLDLLLFGIMCGFFGIFIDFITTPGEILGFYYTYIVKPCLESNRKLIRYIIKPLGGCIYCTNVYITIILYVLICDIIFINSSITNNIAGLLLTLGVQFITIKIYKKWKKKK